MNLFALEGDKKERMDQLRREAEENAPYICPDSKKVVWGEGSLDSPVVIVGEAPGDYEERFGRPFVGPAGKLLERELAKLGIKREDWYITNVVKCRPTTQAGNRVTNRAPTAKEVGSWMTYLMDELAIVQPKIVICMGAIAANNLIHKKFAMTVERGQWFEGPLGTKAIAIFHPSYVLRQQGEEYDRLVELFSRDLRKVLDAQTKLPVTQE
jgi:uracil-DNA glycosylase family 4